MSGCTHDCNQGRNCTCVPQKAGPRALPYLQTNDIEQPGAKAIMNNQDSNMAANAICNAALMYQEAIQQAVQCQTAPSVLYRPKVFPDGNQWCALYGDDLQMGVAGFGNSPAKAMQDFDNNWYKDMEPKP